MNQTGNGIALALQGGGAHGAFAWGVADRLLERETPIARVCGVSSGALLAVALTQGWARGGAAGARVEMRRFWELIARTHTFSPFQRAPLERWLFGWDLSSSFIWQGWETALRLFSPAQLNPLGHNPLRGVVAEFLDREALADPRAPALTVGVTDVETGGAVLFGNGEITTDVLLASTCLPFVFPAIEIGGRAYWDGGYAGNPPLMPLLRPTLPDHLVLVRAQPTRRRGVPTTPAEVMNRMNEIACHNVLEGEIAALPASVRLTIYDADEILHDLPISSKFNADPEFLETLFDAGRHVAIHEPVRGHTTDER